MSSLPPTVAGPATVVLLHSPLGSTTAWEDVAQRLRSADAGAHVVVVSVQAPDLEPPGHRYIARTALDIAAAEAGRSVLLVAAGAAGPLLPRLGAAQRSAHRHVSGYVLLDALLPQPGITSWTQLAREQVEADLDTLPDSTEGEERARQWGETTVPTLVDWPDAPCTYLTSDARFARCRRLAELRGWQVHDVRTDTEHTRIGADSEALAVAVRRLSHI